MAGTAAGRRAAEPRSRPTSWSRRASSGCSSSSSSRSLTLAQTSLAGRRRALVGRLPPGASPTTAAHFLRSFGYALAATLIAHRCSAIRWPTSSRSAPGKFKNLLLGLVILPFFTTFLVRTFAWKTILNDGGSGRRAARSRCTCCRPDGRLLNTTWR